MKSRPFNPLPDMTPINSTGLGRPTTAPALPAALAAIAIGMAAVAPFTPARAADLALTISNIRGGEGSVLLAVYASADDFGKNAVRRIQLPATPPSVTVTIPDLPAGDYAISLLHDRNGNGRLDTNLMGVPTEPYGFSNDPRNLMRPATWEQARFTVPATGHAATVTLSD